MSERFIVAEVSKNWFAGELIPGSTPRLICELFEELIEINHQRGCRLHSWQLHRVMPTPHSMNETIVAVFELPEGEK